MLWMGFAASQGRRWAKVFLQILAKVKGWQSSRRSDYCRVSLEPKKEVDTVEHSLEADE